MRNIYQTLKYFAFAATFAAGASCLAAAQSGVAQNSPAQSSAAMNQANSNSTISQAQQKLKQKGFYRGRIDGIDGSQTRMAIRRYQRSDKLNVSGNLDQATMNSLGLSHMQPSTRGEASRSAEEPSQANSPNLPMNMQSNTPPDMVRAAQQKLSQDGFYSGKIDGVMNQGTQAAIRQYQKANNLPMNGQLTPDTARSLGISTSGGSSETSAAPPLEQLGKGIAEGAKAPQRTTTKRKQ